MVRVFAPASAQRSAAVTSGRSARALVLSELNTHPSPMSALTMPLALRSARRKRAVDDGLHRDVVDEVWRDAPVLPHELGDRLQLAPGDGDSPG